MKVWFALLIALFATPVTAQVFRCQGPEGMQFSDSPCGADAEAVTIRDNRIGGSFNQNLPDTPPPAATEPAPTPTATPEATSPCRYINSTELRTYIAREQVIKGMTRENVLDAFGRPPETYPVPQETWVYHTDYYDKLYELTYVYFRDGCVEQVVYRKP